MTPLASAMKVASAATTDSNPVGRRAVVRDLDGHTVELLTSPA